MFCATAIRFFLLVIITVCAFIVHGRSSDRVIDLDFAIFASYVVHAWRFRPVFVQTTGWKVASNSGLFPVNQVTFLDILFRKDA
jgi:hypothetical protein